jgi:hypothetical protein
MGVARGAGTAGRKELMRPTGAIAVLGLAVIALVFANLLINPSATSDAVDYCCGE